jgi:hypothetical protein
MTIAFWNPFVHSIMRPGLAHWQTAMEARFLPIFAKQDCAGGGTLHLMQALLTDESKPKETEQQDDGGQPRKNAVVKALDLPDCTFVQMQLRCDTKTTVLTRFLDLSLRD